MRVRWDRVGRIGLLVVLVVVASVYAQDALTYFSTRAQADQQQAIVKHLVQANRLLERQQRWLNNPATIEQQARVLGMVRPGERPYLVIGLSATH